MTAVNPPWALAAGSQTPTTHRRMTHFAYGTRGGVLPNGLAVTQRGAGVNMSVDVADGAVVIVGTESAAAQGSYFCENQGTTNLVIGANASGFTRYDLIVAKVQDSAYSGAFDTWSLVVVAGTGAASPVFPAVPANAIVLAVVTVVNGAASIANAAIQDIRNNLATDGTTVLINRGFAALVGGTIICTSVTRPTTNLIEGLEIHETDTDKVYRYDGSGWVEVVDISAGSVWVPTITQGVTVTATTNVVEYSKGGRRAMGNCHLTCTSSGTSTSVISVALPVARATAIDHAIGTGYVKDASANVFPVVVYLSGTQSCSFIRASIEGTTAIFLGSSGLTQLTAGAILSFEFNYPTAT